MTRVLFWAPRVLTILFALFAGVFALDVFGQGYGFWQTAWALLVHLVPTYLVLIALAIAWRWELAGSLLFLGLGVAYIVAFWAPDRWPGYLMITAPLALIGLLFLASWLLRAQSAAA
jgi:hypothetical protein